ncbi:MAG: UDP-N-acetylmuramoyl-L-alanine--D-glutamate ligase [Thermodesulfovibrionales bacterium]|nr:UDP-N-acetylmuramoyl-L-alanine--D-glutamate ligase [Thermodesulfovibrionales bacterium]
MDLRKNPIKDFEGLRVTVVGLARSGVGAANLLAELGAIVTVTDNKDSKHLEIYLRELRDDINLALGGHPHSLFKEADLIIISPGVPKDIEPITVAIKNGIRVIGEIELGYEVVQRVFKNNNKVADFLAITGTNGKSTTTSLLYNMLLRDDLKAMVAGNIGNAFTEEISKNFNDILDIKFYVLEISSFQLESISEFRPTGCSILNITPDHLDRYKSIYEYLTAKCFIFSNQSKKDFIVLNADDDRTEMVLAKIESQRKAKNTAPTIFYFSRKKVVEGAYYDEASKKIFFNIPEEKIDLIAHKISYQRDFFLEPKTFKIKGVHNIENAMASSLMALLSGCSPKAISETLSHFRGLEHRLEFVREIDGVTFINDSKGTNVAAVVKSLESFDQPVILIAGGRDKHGDFSLLENLIREKVKALILIGEAKDKINKALGHLTDTSKAIDLKDAVRKAYSKATSGDVVLLSPACASFDMFIDFEDRGRQFKMMVMEL